MIQANVADAKARFSHFLRLAKSGETVQICERNVPVANLVAIRPPIDRARRESAFGMYAGQVSEECLQESLRPMTDVEADAFLEGRY